MAAALHYTASFRLIAALAGLGAGQAVAQEAARPLIRDQRWLLELDAEKGQERFSDCGESHDGRSYQLVTDSKIPEVVAARARFDQILKNLPSAESFPRLITPETNSRKAKRAAKPAEEDP